MNPLESRLPATLIAALLLGFLIWNPNGSAAHAQPRLAEPGANTAATITTPVLPPSVLVAGFRAPLTEYGAGHRGIDLEVAEGDTVLASADGVISFSGAVATKNVVTVTTANGLRLSAEPVCTTQLIGTRVSLGEAIGQVCGLGYASHCTPGLCLHFSARNEFGYLSPLCLMGQSGPSHLVA